RATEKLCEANNVGGGLSLRVETGRITPEDLLRRLADEGVAARRHPLLPAALAVERTSDLLRAPSFGEGLCYVQDVASQVLAAWAAPALLGRVLDVCAAPGGKLTLLAGLRGERRWVAGGDVAPARLELIRQNLARLRLPATPLLCADGRRLPFGDGCWDGVVLDVPCSATGMIRKYPELKWRWSEAGLAAHANLQGALLAEGARVVRPGGRLLYVTCSLEPEENADAVAALLAARPDFGRVSFGDLPPPRGLGEPPGRFVTRAGDFLMLPGADRMGMYGALLRREG
ncbi:MAG: RsmB/NOP family class I SAM-dependent RNA methyltransferase, partial [bacterium]